MPISSYVLRVPPEISTVQELRDYVWEELRQITLAFESFDVAYFRVLHVEPEKLQDGMVAFADGTDWNPGGGGGLYQRVSGAWVKL